MPLTVETGTMKKKLVLEILGLRCIWDKLEIDMLKMYFQRYIRIFTTQELGPGLRTWHTGGN